jgi:hypothetical protein
LREFIARAPAAASAAEVTRQVGDLAWLLGFPRPSYQRVRVLHGERHGGRVATVSTPAPGVARYILKTLDFLYQYPAPGMRNWYLGYLGVAPRNTVLQATRRPTRGP